MKKYIYWPLSLTKTSLVLKCDPSSRHPIQDPMGGTGHLVSIHSEDEALSMQSLVTMEGWEYWIGLRMNCPTCDFSWSD